MPHFWRVIQQTQNGGIKMNKNDQEFLVQKIRSQYTEKESTKLDELKALDKKVKKPANVFAYVFGSFGAVIMGAGMSLVMTELGETLGMGDAMVPGVIVGVIGLILVLINYPMYKKFLEKRKEKYAERIIELSNKLMED